MNWIELSTKATDEAIDWIRTLLASIHFSGKLQMTQQSNLSATEQLSEWPFIIQMYLPNEAQPRTQVDQLLQVLSPLQRTGMIADMQTAIVDELVIHDLSPIHRVGRFVILPLDGNEYLPKVDEIPLQVEQTLAFGSGFHPATVLSLKLLEQFVMPEMQALDLGCGSGILSIAMAKLGATVTAIDNDPTAIAATQQAIHQNHVAQSVTTLVGSLGGGSQLGHWLGEALNHEVQVIQPTNNFDLIVANIFARIHLSLVEDYRNALCNDSDRSGFLITSGYDIDYEQEIRQTFAQAGFKLLGSKQIGTWIAQVHQLHR
jgi:ribosomal protein L11 methyltransferase